MSYIDEVQKTIEAFGDDAVEVIINGPKKILVYVVEVGLEHIKAKKRRERRRELRTEIKPQFVPGRVTGSVQFSKATKSRLLKATQELFGDAGWKIGNLSLGDFTKEQLLAQASNERASAKGSLRNAQFYEALAEPMLPGQKVGEYWKPEAATKVKQGIWKTTEGQTPLLG